MNPFLIKHLQTLPPSLDIPIIRIVNHDLSTLNREEIPDLFLEFGFYP